MSQEVYKQISLEYSLTVCVQTLTEGINHEKYTKSSAVPAC